MPSSSSSSNTAIEGWYAHSERTSQTDDQRIKDVMPLPPPEHLIRFFPIAGTPVETLIGDTRAAIRRIMQKKDDRLLVIMGPCSIHDPVAAVEYAADRGARVANQRLDRRAGDREEADQVFGRRQRHHVLDPLVVGLAGAFGVRIPAAVGGGRIRGVRHEVGS